MNVRVIEVAVAYVASPDCAATKLHTPTPVGVTMPFEIVQTLADVGVVMATASPEVDVAVTAKDGVLRV